MSFDEFATSIKRDAQPPLGTSAALRALWHDARGDWHGAHDCLQGEVSREGDWVHAYLHRKEGDLGNAGYWYSRAGRTMPRQQDLASEWTEIARQLLATD